jgi:hypothetical protein
MSESVKDTTKVDEEMKAELTPHAFAILLMVKAA